VTPIDWHPSPARLAPFGWVASGVFACLSIAARAGRLPALHGVPAPEAATVFATIAGVSAFFSVVFPRANWPLYVGVTAVGLPVRWIVSTAALAATFFFVVTPVGWVRRLVAGDPLTRKWDPAEKTYWVASRPTRPPEDYFRLF
jgi:hypothetical protein